MFVWLFGPSCAGKKCTAMRMEAQSDHPVRSWIQLPDPVVAVRSALEGFNRPSNATIFEEIRSLAQSPGSYLTKAQRPDIGEPEFTGSFPAQLIESFPEGRHEIVFVWTDPTQLREQWFRSRGGELTVGGHASELAEQLNLVPKLAERLGLRLTWVDNREEIPLNERPPDSLFVA